MSAPKNFRNDLNILPQKIGDERNQEIIDMQKENSTFLPRQIQLVDLDEGFINFVKNDIKLVLDGKEVPVIFLTLQRWSEFTKTWQFTDEHKDIQMPFISIVRNPDIQPGQNQAGLWNIPGKRTFFYVKVPTKDDSGRVGIDLYKIPQPTPVDVTYNVRIFTNKMKDLNDYSTIIEKTFHSRQHYITVEGRYMPINKEATIDESNIDDVNERKFYCLSYEMVLLGVIQEAKDFEIVPTINRVMGSVDLDIKNNKKTSVLQEIFDQNHVDYNFIFKENSNSEFRFNSQYDVTFTELINVEKITRIIITINGINVFDGLSLTSSLVFKANDVIKVKIYKNNNDIGKFQLTGTI